MEEKRNGEQIKEGLDLLHMCRRTKNCQKRDRQGSPCLMDKESLKRMTTHHKLLSNPSLKILNTQPNAFLICFTVSAGPFSKFKTVHQT